MTPGFDLSGRRALVTGANAGIGQAIAVALAAAGAEVLCAGRSAMDETLAAIAAAGGRGHACTMDLSESDGAVAAYHAAAAAHGPVDVLVNNAGIIRRTDALEFSTEDWDAVMNVNLRSAFFLTQVFARPLIAAGQGGAVINIASLLSFQGGIRIASYTASKSGLAGLTRLLACEWAGRGIRVNAIAPGYIATANTAPLRADPERNNAILARIPAGRWGEAADIGGAAVFLASPAATYVHGVVLPVDGGWMAR